MVAYLLITELDGASDSKLVLWGTVLLLVNLGTVVLAIVLQIAEANRKTVIQLILLEREIREAEFLVDSQSLRTDVERLQCAAGVKLSLPTLTTDVMPDLDDASAAAKLQAALFLERIEGSPVPSHTKLLYPWCVENRRSLRTMTDTVGA